MDVNELFERGKKFFKRSPPKETPKKSIERPPDTLYTQMLGGGDAAKQLAEQLGMAILQELPPSLPREIYKKVPYAFAKKHTVLPIGIEEGEITVAIADPLNLEPLDELRHMLGASIRPVFCHKENILAAINECYNKESGAAEQLLADLGEQGEAGATRDVEAYDLLDDTHEYSNIVKLLNLIVTEAIQQNASDIHFEPLENSLRVRYRIDGVLHNRHAPASEYQSQLLTRIKVMAKMDIAEKRLPQDGRIKLKLGRREIDFRVSTVPVVNGERIVLRILDKGNVTLGLHYSGMTKRMLTEFERLIHLPEGIILVTGPTGSGKTTTLYSAISDLTSPEINIMTIEDPVEYNLKSIAQIGVKPKIDLTFAAGLRHILRQDPDVIMIGEIRDRETAEIAIQSSLTGHLVLSTLHTNDAPSAVTRLVDMGIEPYLLSSTLVGVLAQRLVRKICPHCKEEYQPTDEELKSLQIKRETLSHGVLFRGRGCDLCYGSGYHGRHGVYELMTITPKLQQQIVKTPDAIAMRDAAMEEGMLPLREHGAELVRTGITTIAEVLRVTRGATED